MIGYLREELTVSFYAALDLQTYVMLWGIGPGEDRYEDIVVDGRGLIGFASFRAGFIGAWCNWEWEEIGLCRPLHA